MFTPIPFSSNSNSISASSSGNNGSNTNRSNVSNTNRNTNATPISVSGHSGTQTTGTRRRGSSLNMLLNTFGIRHASSHTSSTNHSSPVREGDANGHSQENTLRASAQRTASDNLPTQNSSNLNNITSSEFYQLPISLLLTAQNESVSTNDNNTNANINNTNRQQTNNNSNIELVATSPTGDSNAYFNISSVAVNNLTSNSDGGDINDISISSLDGNSTLRNLRHYIYAADQKNPDELLKLDLPRTGRQSEMIDDELLNQRKDKNGLFSIRLTPFIDNSSSSNPGLFFDPAIRTAGPGSQLVIGRYTERVREAISKIPEQYHPVVFKSKVVSRTHGCLKVDSQGNWYVKDIKSSSGTFLNHQRLSPASTLSKDTLLHDGDVLQLGMDFRGGTEEIYRCVKMRVELNKSWKRKAKAFNKEALQRIRNLQKLTVGLEEEDCSICLSSIKPCQAIFISPCSHSWHFHCIRRLVMISYPQFVCPNCRSSCDLEASLETSDESNDDDDDDENDDDDVAMNVNDEMAFDDDNFNTHDSESSGTE